MKVLFSVIAILCSASLFVHAQEFQASVSVNTDLIPVEQRIDLGTMRQDVETYVNNQRYTNMDWEGPKIPVDIGITITSKSGNRFSAFLTISSYRIVDKKTNTRSVVYRTLDKEWSFEYQLNANLTFQNLRFDPFSSLLDFHLLMALGMDMDSYGELDGQQMFSSAKQICLLGANNNAPGYQRVPEPGVYSRIALATEYNDLRFDDFRKIVFSYYVDGLEEYYKDKQKGLDNMAYAIQQIATFKEKRLSARSIVLQAFFDAKFQELAGYFKGYPDPKLWQNLRYLDPSNGSVYDEAKKP
ncbi:MAG TPA: DUF4835 family protein [Candidatus Kapabacteria bacterium]|nr:DUF4835 family protein [Candidatus Kapabacteria bacterium]